MRGQRGRAQAPVGLGVTISIDDFGTTIPAAASEAPAGGKVKIEPRLCESTGKRQRGCGGVAAIVALAQRRLNLRIVAEGA